MRVTLLLADSAQADKSGKVHALGMGWTTTTAPLPPFALVIFLDIDWDETNQPHKLRCELLSEDGEAVTVPGPFGEQPIVVEAQAEAGRPPGAINGTAARLPFAVNVGAGTPLNPGRYQWRVSVEGFDNVVAAESFLVRES